MRIASWRSGIGLLLVVFTVTACGGESRSATDEPAGRPNIILMMADDLGWGDTSFNGHPHLKTPSLDGMAANGLVMNRFYSAAPVCSPTRASVLTGRHPFRDRIFFATAGVSKLALPPQQYSLAPLFDEAGYRTGFFGKWHLGSMTREVADGRLGGNPAYVHLYSPPWEHGFETVFATESRVPTYDPMIRPRNQGGPDARSMPAEIIDKTAVRGWWLPLENPEDGIPWGTQYWNGAGEPAAGEFRGEDSRIIIDEVIRFVEAQKEDSRPFIAVVWFHTPHLPLVAGDDDRAAYAEHDFYDRTYYAAVSALDREIGRLREALSDQGVADNTVLWFTSDNGPEGLAGRQPGRTGGLRERKRSLYEGGIRVPGIIEWPAHIDAGRTTGAPAVTSDILPTILGWAGTELLPGHLIDGIDIDPIVTGAVAERGVPIGFESQNQLAWIDDRYKLIHGTRVPEAMFGQNKATELKFELYDIVNDPGETIDIASQHPDIVARMTLELEDWRASVAASIENGGEGLAATPRDE